MAFTASHRFARISPTKVRPIADQVRRKNVALAMESLSGLPNRGARILEKVIASAVANAKEQGAREPGDMYLSEVLIDEGPRMKRIRPRARGMAYQIIKRMSHVRVTIDDYGA